MNNLNDGKIFFSGFVLGAFTFILLLYMTKPEAQQPVASKSNFEVVDTYSYENRTCSVIRYTTPSTTWEYFLDCKEVKNK
jgi:hypothetical protein